MGFAAGAVVGVIGILVLQVAFDSFMDWWANFVETLKDWGRTVYVTVSTVAIFCCLLYAAGWRP